MQTVFKVFIEFVTTLLLFYDFLFVCFLFFDPEACEILAPLSGIKPARPALEGEALTTGPPGESLSINFGETSVQVFCPFLNQISVVAVKVRSPSRILDLHGFSQTHDWHMLSPICSSLFTLFVESCPAQKSFQWMGARQPIFACLACLLKVLLPEPRLFFLEGEDSVSTG